MTKLLILLTLLSSAAFAQQNTPPTQVDRQVWEAYLTQKNDPSLTGIPFLIWETNRLKVRTQANLSYVEVVGKITDATVKSLEIDGKILTLKSGIFAAGIAFSGGEREFLATAITTDGKTFTARYRVTGGKNPKSVIYERFHANIGMGLTHVSYTQTAVTPFTETELTLKGGMSYALKPNKWDLGLSFFMNVASLNTTSDLYSIRYLGVNLRAGYHLIPIQSRFQFNLNGGIYYNTSFADIGFKNMIGPQVYPEFSYLMPNRQTIFTYFKYSPVFVSASSLDLANNREIATGVYYSFPVLVKNRLSIGFDFSKLDLAVSGLTSNTTTYSLSVGIAY